MYYGLASLVCRILTRFLFKICIKSYEIEYFNDIFKDLRVIFSYFIYFLMILLIYNVHMYQNNYKIMFFI